MPDSSSKSPSDLDSALGAMIRLRRRSLGMSQDQLAASCGVSFQQIQKYENGSNRISFSRLVQIAQALGCRVRDLVSPLDAEVTDVETAISTLDLLRTPGADELLSAYERLSPDARATLVPFVENVAANQG